MSALTDVLASVDGLREDAARRVAARFDSVAELAGADPADLEAIRGVGQVMSGRILQAAMQARARVDDPGRMAKDANARTAATADKVIDTAGKVAGGTIGRTSGTAREVVGDAEITARTGVYRIHAKSDETVDKAVEAVEGTKFVAKSVADRAVDTAMSLGGKAVEVTGAVAKSTLEPARKVLEGLLGRDRDED
ncbi:helix-hairpin-helix domain-containing protein [Salsipaludibacter albus]|uniref:helix-hairpin-helix domain-containing protein n=1 Tax=Salsipaludibacter albus TaxID=2849650 RepID=UPI001EE456CC|nr:helix-hairpin-helix domain-containing protein [Salsipaludibacter albus]MBY5162225.1 hypothetical protein [Salsipaludibacter albus]